MPCPHRPCFSDYPVPALPADATQVAREAPGGTRSIGPGPGIKRPRDVGAQPLTLTNPGPQLYDALSYPFENLPGFSEATFGVRAASQALRGHPAEAAGNAALALSAPILGGVLGRRAVSIARKAEATGTWHLVANEARDLSLLPSRTPAQARKLQSLSEALRSAPQEALPPLEQSAMAPGSRMDLSGWIGTGPESITPEALAQTKIMGRVDPSRWKVSPEADATYQGLERRRAERLIPPAPEPAPAERVIGAAVRGADGVWYTGPNHGMAADAAREGVKKNLSPAAWAEIKSVIARGSMDSFKTSTGRIVSRDEAAAIARRAQQTALAPQYSALHSSDLIPENRAAPNVLVTSPQGRALHDALTKDEASLLRAKDIPQFEAAAEALPRTGAFGAGALAGSSKLGWYKNSAKALVDAFGPEAPRFAALLSALSPQRDVKNNLSAALSMWEAWTSSGRPTDPRRLTILLNQVERAAPGGKAMGSRVSNALRALTSDDPAKLVLSGPKVNAFHKNLIGDTQRVTLDTWMGQLANVSGESLRGASRKGVLGAGVLGPNPLYSAYSGRIRQTATELSQLTGRAWSPAEVQETLWSWGKALSETAMPSTKGMHPSELARMSPGDLRSAIGNLPESAVRGVPDFSTLLSEPGPFQQSLSRMGLKTPAPAPATPSPTATPDIFELDGLARNIERSRLGLFGLNEVGALGKGPGRLVFHGTTKPGFDVPTLHNYGPGVHVGTAGQADEILRGAPWDPPGRLISDSWRPAGSRIIPLRDLTSKPLLLNKDAAWGDPVTFAQNLVEQGTITKEEAASVASPSDRSDWGNAADFSKIRQLLIDKGYDRIDYRNKVEADRWVGRQRPRRVLANSSVILDPEQHLVNALAPDPTDAGLTGLKMLGGMAGVGIGAAGAPWLWNYIHNKPQP